VLPPYLDRSTPTYPHRQPSAHLSEIGSVDESHFSSHVQNDNMGEDEYDNAIVRYGAREGNVSGQQGYAEVRYQLLRALHDS
jgi:hypothetical protein